MDRAAQGVEITWKNEARAAGAWLHSEVGVFKGHRERRECARARFRRSINARAASPTLQHNRHFNTESKPFFTLLLTTDGQFHQRLD